MEARVGRQQYTIVHIERREGETDDQVLKRAEQFVRKNENALDWVNQTITEATIDDWED